MPTRSGRSLRRPRSSSRWRSARRASISTVGPRSRAATPRYARGGSRTRLDVGDTFRNKDLLRAMLMASDNRAPTALGRAAGMTPDELVAAMNGDREGSPPQAHQVHRPDRPARQRVDRARDGARAARRARGRRAARDHGRPVRDRRRARAASRRSRTASTNQPLVVKKYDVIGGKTGYTEAAGYCFITAATVRRARGRDGVPRRRRQADAVRRLQPRRRVDRQRRAGREDRAARPKHGRALNIETRAARARRQAVASDTLARDMESARGARRRSAWPPRTALLGCGAGATRAAAATAVNAAEIRTWLHDAVATLARRRFHACASARGDRQPHDRGARRARAPASRRARSDGVVLSTARTARARDERSVARRHRGRGAGARRRNARTCASSNSAGARAFRRSPDALAEYELIDRVSALGEPRSRAVERGSCTRRRCSSSTTRTCGRSRPGAISSSGSCACASRSRASRGTARGRSSARSTRAWTGDVDDHARTSAMPTSSRRASTHSP